MMNKQLPKDPAENADCLSQIDFPTDHSDETEELLFYRWACPNCGKEALEFRDPGQFVRAPFLGVTEEGAMGCGLIDVDGDPNPEIFCRECGSTLCREESLQIETLLKFARTYGRQLRRYGFNCPACGSTKLCQVEIALEISREIEAVYEDVVDAMAGNQTAVAMSCCSDRLGGGSIRYRCNNGHELAKEDGSPIKTGEELLDWLKLRRTFLNG